MDNYILLWKILFNCCHSVSTNHTSVNMEYYRFIAISSDSMLRCHLQEILILHVDPSFMELMFTQ